MGRTTLALLNCASGNCLPRKKTQAANRALGLVFTIVPTACSRLTHLEIAYGLRYAELNNKRSVQDHWSMRQTAIYHKFKKNDNSSSWVMIAPSKRTETSLDRYIKSCENIAQLNPFEIHLIVLDTALANWRPYIVGLTEKITQQVRTISNVPSSISILTVETE